MSDNFVEDDENKIYFYIIKWENALVDYLDKIKPFYMQIKNQISTNVFDKDQIKEFYQSFGKKFYKYNFIS